MKTPTRMWEDSQQVTRYRVLVYGIVQGVGFRPFVYRLARELQLTGYVLNFSEGVAIEVEGPAETLREFTERLRSAPPVQSRIDDVRVTVIPVCGDLSFEIRHSEAQPDKFGLTPPDIGTCEECRKDFTDPGNRRYLYPFTNCTNCGPRYTIIQDIPYDRPKTTMSRFPMCPECQAEYDDPLNRRFHAQPNACPVCGPHLELVRRHGELTVTTRKDVLEEIRWLLGSGAIAAIKGLGGFHLACDALNQEAVARLRERKRRSDKAFALMAPDVETIEAYCALAPADREALLHPRRPIVLLERRPGANGIPEAVAPGNRTLGFMLPYTPLHHLLFDDTLRVLVMTSGNSSEEPIVSRNEEISKLDRLADCVLLHNRDIQTRVDDSVIRTFEGRPLPVRRSRGYAPDPIDLGMPLKEVLACGGELKNTFCLTKDHYAILSQHIGDLENVETMLFFNETLEHMQRFFRVNPEIVAHDLHPGYLSTRFALDMVGVLPVGVQHHHAHIASCMAENGLREKVIGVAFDGTGYGTDGKIWGGEFLIADYIGFKRAAHLRYIPLPGGDTAVRQPWRAALSYLRDTFGNAAGELDLPLFREVPPRSLSVVDAMIARRINSIETSSCGRLFDAVASMLGLRQETNYEGQAAIELEAFAAQGVEESYPFEIGVGEAWELDLRPAIAALVSDSAAANIRAARFHNTVSALLVEVCRRLSEREGLRRVCLSGGTFQNMYLLRRSVAALRRCGLEVFTHSKVPANDGGLALGQAVIASFS